MGQEYKRVETKADSFQLNLKQSVLQLKSEFHFADKHSLNFL